MAKKPATPKALTFVDIVMGADADVIKSAYEARVKIDDLLHQREEAYRQIQALEEQVDDIMGDSGVYLFPAPPYAVAGSPAGGRTKKAKPTPKPPSHATRPAAQPGEERDEQEATAETEAVSDEPSSEDDNATPADSAAADDAPAASDETVSEEK